MTKTTSAGASALTVAAKPFQPIIAKIAVGGVLATATVMFSTDGGLTFGPPVATAATLMCPQAPYVTFAFSAGTYVAADLWTVATDGTVTFTGTGNNGCTISSSSPVDGYSLLVSCIAGGALGTATFSFSLDGGNVWSGTLLVPASGKYVIPDVGLLLTFSGTLVAGEAWSCTIAPATYSGTDLTNALNAALPVLRQYGVVTGSLHVVGPAATVAGAATLAATLQSLLTTAGSAYQYLRGLVEFPADTDANIANAVAAVGALQVGGCAGFAYVISPLNGRQMLASSAWLVAARLASSIAISEDLGYVERGPLSGASLSATNPALAVQRDESTTPALDAARLITLRTIAGLQGLYITNGRLLAPGGSDYTFLQYGMIIDVAAAAARRALLKYLNAKVRVNGPPKKAGQPAIGTIYESDARSMENWVNQRMTEALVQPGDASQVQATASRTANVLSTQQLPWTVGVLPPGYTKYLPVSVGYLPVTA